MAYDVFISYSSKDKPIADAVCATLESECIRCWIAPRDVEHGRDWGESIIEAINGSRVMVLVLSRHANSSPQISREVERAVSKGIPVIPLRIEDIKPTASLEYFLSTPHWLDAFNPPLERHLRYLAQVIQKILRGPAKRVASENEPIRIAPSPVAREVVAEVLKEAATTADEIRFTCLRCGQSMLATESAAGTTIACPNCGQPTLIPQTAPPANAESRAKLRKPALIWILVALAVLALTVAGLSLGLRHHAEPPRPLVAESMSSGDPGERFVELEGDNGFVASPGVPESAIAALRLAQGKYAQINSFIFTPVGGWIVLDSDGFLASDDSKPDGGKAGWRNHLENARCIAISSSGNWVGLYPNNGLWGPGSPAWLKVKELGQTGHQLRSLALGPGDSFVILYDKAGASYYGVPPALAKVLDDAVNNGVAIQCVAFKGTDWICLSADRCWASRSDLAAAKIIDQRFKQGAHPKWIAFGPQSDNKLKAKWTEALNQAVHDLKNNSDYDSANFVSDIFTALARPDGLSDAALDADGQRIRGRIRELVRRNALESAAILQVVLYNVFPIHGNDATGPTKPNDVTGGVPGPGGLILHFSFGKPSADGVVRDQSGAGNDGHVFGARWVPDETFGGAYQFHITNLTDRIVVPNSDTLNPDYITIAAWIKAADGDGFWNRILDKDYRNAYCLDLGGDWKNKASRGKLQFEISAGNIESDYVLNDGQWHHVAATYDGSTLRCYVDGIQKSRRARQSGPLKKTGWDLCIGNSEVDYGTGEFLAFDGQIAEVRIYNRALSSDEIEFLATANSAGKSDKLAYQTSFGPGIYHPGPLAGQDGWNVDSVVSGNAARVVQSGSGQSLLISGSDLERLSGNGYGDSIDFAKASCGKNWDQLSSSDYEMRYIRPLAFGSNAIGMQHIKLTVEMQLSLDPQAAKTDFHGIGVGLIFPGSLTNRMVLGRTGRLFADTYYSGHHQTGAAGWPNSEFHQLGLDCDFVLHRVTYYLDGHPFCALFMPNCDTRGAYVYLTFFASKPTATTLLIRNLEVTQK